MKIPFFLKKKKINNNNLESQKNLSDDNFFIDEKEQLLGKLNQDKLQFLFSLYNFNKENISLDFVKILDSNPELFTYLTDHIIGQNIVSKINENNLRVQDIKEYDKALFQYDIFSDEDKELLNILRSEVTLSDNIYASFLFDNFEKEMNSDEFIDVTIYSFFDEKLIADRQKAITLDGNRVSFDDEIKIVTALDKDKLFAFDVFDKYYSGDLSFNSDNILFIPYKDFLEWSKKEDKLNILRNVQVVINDDMEKFFEISNNINWHFYQYCKPITFDNEIDKLIIKINHLLYLIDNSNLDVEDKELFRYKVTKVFNGSDNDFRMYSIEREIEKIANSFQNKIEKEELKELTNQFNQLDKEIKLKEISKPKFSVNLFLRQFDNLDAITSFDFLNYIARLNEDEKRQVLSSEVVINKLQGLLKESAKDEYPYYEKFMKALNVEDIFKIFDAEFIKHYYHNNRNQNEYRFFFTLLEKDINQAVEYLLKDETYFEEFVKDISYYNFSKLDYSLLVQVIKKIEEMDLNVNFSIFGSAKNTDQFKLLKEDFSNDMLIKIIPNLNKKVQQFFYLEDKRFNYLYDKFNIFDLIVSGYQFSSDVIEQQEFFEKFKSTSLVQFRTNINQFELNQPNIFFEDKINRYEKKLIESYDLSSGLFNQYKYLLENINLLDDSKFIYKGIDFFYDTQINYEIRNFIGYDDNDEIFIKDKEGIVKYLQEVSKRKLNEVIVDFLFKDNIYNVFLNIKEMIRYSEGLIDNEKVLDEDQINFYKTILNLDHLNKETILEVYDKFKDKNIALMFYEDLQKVKNKCYDKIKSELFQPEKMVGNENKELTSKHGVNIYDLRDKEYVILARCLNDKYAQNTHNKRDCYTLLSNENSTVFYRDSYIYGYSGFDNDCVLHMFEGDAYSGDINRSKSSVSSDRVNRIMTAQEIATNSSMYSEVQIVNKDSEVNNGMFETLRPSFLIVYDEISENIVEEAKRQNIPICIIRRSIDRTLEGQIPFNDRIDKYTHERWISNEEERQKHR